MKQEQELIQYTEKTTNYETKSLLQPVYIADDGQKFLDAVECASYELLRHKKYFSARFPQITVDPQSFLELYPWGDYPSINNTLFYVQDATDLRVLSNFLLRKWAYNGYKSISYDNETQWEDTPGWHFFYSMDGGDHNSSFCSTNVTRAIVECIKMSAKYGLTVNPFEGKR